LKNCYLELLETITFFVDRSLGGQIIPKGLKKLKLNVVNHDDLFEKTAQDIEWIKLCGERKWYILSVDNQIRRNELEKKALKAAKVGAFILTNANKTGVDQLEMIKKALNQIFKIIKDEPLPFIAIILSSGKVDLIEKTSRKLY